MRLRSLDVARGIVVGVSAAMSHIPAGGFEWARHADWYGLSGLDLILPAFMTLFGAGIAVAYRDRVRWPRVARRTVLLIALGLIFNAMTEWSVDPATWRLTGVLQQFAVAGLIVVLVTRVARSWWSALAVAGAMLAVNLVGSLAIARDCAGALPQPGCTLSTVVDFAVFGPEHLYREGARGFDPEGLATLLGQVPNVLLGYVGGRLLWERRQRGAAIALLLLGIGLIVAALLLSIPLPIGKRMWTPAFASVTAAVAILLLAAAHVVIDRQWWRSPSAGRAVRAATWLPEAFGRNSLFIYFGKYFVVALMANLTLAGDRSVARTLLDWIATWSPAPQVTYAALMFAAWATVAVVLHRSRVYIRI